MFIKLLVMRFSVLLKGDRMNQSRWNLAHNGCAKFHAKFGPDRWGGGIRVFRIQNLVKFKVFRPQERHSVLFLSRPWSEGWPHHGLLSPFISILCHSDWLFHRESCPRLDVVYPSCAWSSSPAYTWHCSLHYFFLQAISLFPHGVTIVC